MLAGYRMVGFVPSRDLERARAFYERVLGFRVVESDGFAVTCTGGGARLRITKVGPFTPHAFTTLGWTVASIRKQIDALVKRGVAFKRFGGFQQDPRGIWTAPGGTRVAWFKDPDGNLLSLTEAQD